MRNQRTIKTPATIAGVGLHTGAPVTLNLKPAEPDAGVVFVRSDVPHRPRINLRRDAIVPHKARQTAIGSEGTEVHTVEHLAATLLALGIDNVLVEMDGPEIPGMDGSSLPFVDVLRQAGRLEQKAPRKEFRLDKPLAVEKDDASIVAFPSENGLRISYTLSYPESRALRSQHVTVDVDEEHFVTQIAPARTFCLEREAQALQAAGLGKGANTRNTLVIGEDGVIDNTLRFSDEPARHKILDLLGDLSLLGADLKATIVATKTGHTLNHELVAQLAARMSELEVRGAIQRDTGLQVQEIMKIIPHRYPFLFIDRVIELIGFQRAVAIKNVSFNEPYFQGHWPGQPIMPGVLQVEALAQLSGVLLLRKIQNTGKVAVLLAIDRIKFRRPVVPGDQLRLHCETLFLKARSGKVLGRATVNGELTCEAVMKFMLMDA